MAGIPIYGNEQGPGWVWWVVEDLDLVVWLNRGPSAGTRLPTLDELGPLVRASQGVEASWDDTVRVPRCTTQQLALHVEILGGGPVVELTHVSGTACRSPRLPIDIVFFDRDGNAVEATANIAGAFQPTIVSPGVDMVVGFTVVRLCGKAKPRRFVAEAGPYFARASLSRGAFESCLTDLGP